MIGAFAAADFFESFFDDEGVEAEGVFVDAAVREGQSGGLAVGDHDDLAHVFVRTGEDALVRRGGLRGCWCSVGRL